VSTLQTDGWTGVSAMRNVGPRNNLNIYTLYLKKKLDPYDQYDNFINSQHLGLLNIFGTDRPYSILN